MTTNAALQALVDAKARSIRAFNDSEQTWQDCQHKPIHHRGRYCEHQVLELANHLTRNRIQREDAQRQALVEALRNYVHHDDWLSSEINEKRLLSNLADWYHQAQAALKGLEA